MGQTHRDLTFFPSLKHSIHVNNKAVDIQRRSLFLQGEVTSAYVRVCMSFSLHVVYVYVRERERAGESESWVNSCIDLVLFAVYSEQKCKPWEHLESGENGRRGGGGVSSAPGSVPSIHGCTNAHTHTPHMCEGSLGSQSAALNKAFLFLPLIAGSICHWGVQFLISALTERGEVGKNTKWMHLLTNEIKPLHLHFPPFPPAGTMLPCLALGTLSYFPLTGVISPH